MVVPQFDMALFAALGGSAVYLHRRPQVHKRLMLLATLSLLGAAAARLPRGYHLSGTPVVYGFIVVDALVLLGVLHDVATRGRAHQAYLWGGLLIFAPEPLRLAIGGRMPGSPSRAFSSGAEALDIAYRVLNTLRRTKPSSGRFVAGTPTPVEGVSCVLVAPPVALRLLLLPRWPPPSWRCA